MAVLPKSPRQDSTTTQRGHRRCRTPVRPTPPSSLAHLQISNAGSSACPSRACHKPIPTARAWRIPGKTAFLFPGLQGRTFRRAKCASAPSLRQGDHPRAPDARVPEQVSQRLARGAAWWTRQRPTHVPAPTIAQAAIAMERSGWWLRDGSANNRPQRPEGLWKRAQEAFS